MPPRPAPSATRALTILDLLAGHPNEAFTLTDIARDTGINVASAHAILNAMVEAGYLVRHPAHKSYTLGPSVVAIGNAALDAHPVIAVARAELKRIADELDLECMVSVPFGDELVVVGRAGRPNPHRPLIRVGQRMPLVPPLGITYLAWAHPDDIEDWLARADSQTPDELERFRAALTAARALGYVVHLQGEDLQPRPVEVVGNPPRLDLGQGRHPVTAVAAPAFDHDGAVTVVLNVDGFPEPLTTDEVAYHGERLRDLGLVITRLADGVPPGESRPRRTASLAPSNGRRRRA